MRRFGKGKLAVVGAVAGFASIAGLTAGGFVVEQMAFAKVPASAVTPRDAMEWFDPVVDVQQMIVRNYVREPDLAAMQEAVIDGMIESLGDPYTDFIPTKHLDEFNKSVRGDYVGIGAQVRTDDGWLGIVTPLENSPALRAGLVAGDRVVAIEGVETFEKSVRECIELLVGEEGTPVVLTIKRDSEQFDVEVIRGSIHARSVYGARRVGERGDQWSYMLDPTNKVGYVRLSQFTGTTGKELQEAIEMLDEEGVQGLILDVRFNPGGLLSTAVEIADLFLDRGVIVSSRGRTHPEEVASASFGSFAKGVPLLILANRQSASASEVITGALVDNSRAVMLGERTFGKGSVQRLVPLPSGGGQLKITEQLYYLPSGRCIHRMPDAKEWGIDPTPGFYVPMDNDAIYEMTEVRSKREAIRAGGDPSLPPTTEVVQWVRETYADEQLATGLDAVLSHIEQGEWIPPRDTEEAGLEIRADELLRAQQARDAVLRQLDRLNERLSVLEAGGEDLEAADEKSLLPDEAVLEGGMLQIYDINGELIAELEITDDSLERWFVGAPLRKANSAETPAATGE